MFQFVNHIGSQIESIRRYNNMTLSDVLLGHEMFSLVLSFVGCYSLITCSFGLGTTSLAVYFFSPCLFPFAQYIILVRVTWKQQLLERELISGNQTVSPVRQTCRSMSLVVILCLLTFVCLFVLS